MRPPENWHMGGRLICRPASNHPDRDHWERLRAIKRAEQTVDGQVECGCCPAKERDVGTLDLHHRHYDTFGAERPCDVVLLCRRCHDAITNRLRAERIATGDRAEAFKKNLQEEEKKTRQAVTKHLHTNHQRRSDVPLIEPEAPRKWHFG